MTALDKFLDLKRMYNPKTGEEMPYKPLLLLLAVVDLIEAGEVSAERIPWGSVVCDRFGEYFEVIRKPGLVANVADPFPRLQTDGIWGQEPPLGDGSAVDRADAGGGVGRK